MGKISIYNEDLSISDDNSDVRVRIYNKNNILVDSTITDTRGFYVFPDISYGTYLIDIMKNNYIKSIYFTKEIKHIGGYSPTIKDCNMYAIPDYIIDIDSLKVKSAYREIYLYMKVNGENVPFSSYQIIGFCDYDSNVSIDKYSFTISGGVSSDYKNISGYDQTDAIISSVNHSFSADTIYVRFYLLSFGQNTYSFTKEGLGKPSNVMSFVWQ